MRPITEGNRRKKKSRTPSDQTRGDKLKLRINNGSAPRRLHYTNDRDKTTAFFSHLSICLCKSSGESWEKRCGLLRPIPFNFPRRLNASAPIAIRADISDGKKPKRNGTAIVFFPLGTECDGCIGREAQK